MAEPLYLNDQTLANLNISTTDIVSAIEQTILGIRHQTVSAAPKTSVSTADGRFLMATLAASDSSGLIAVKSVLLNTKNTQKQLPVINGGIMLLDSDTGQILAVLDANWITAVRTAGLSAVAAKRLANPNSQNLGLIGTGVQAESHLRAFSDLYPLHTVRAFGRGTAGIQRIQSVAQQLGLEFEHTNAQACLAQSDIVVSSVSRDYAIDPFLNAAWLADGSFAAIADLAIPWEPAALSAFNQIYIDDLAQERIMERPMVPVDRITGELADLVINKDGYKTADRTAFIFRGIAAGDLAVASLAYHRAIEKNA